MSKAFQHTPHWFRICGYGLSWTCEPPLFSERYGYRTPLFRVGPYRFFWLRRNSTLKLAMFALLLALSVHAEPRTKLRRTLLIASIVALNVATAVDVGSTLSVTGRRLPNGRVIGESNGLLASTHHRFGARGIGISLGASGAISLGEWLILRKTNRYDVPMTVNNAGAAAVHLFVARRNWGLSK